MSEKKPAKRVTLKDVAKEANVSLGTASYAVNGNGSVDEQNRAHILKVAKQLGYRQNMSARAMRTGRTGALGLVVPDFSNPFFTTLAEFVMRAARLKGYGVFVSNTEGSDALEQEAVKLMVKRGVDGIVWFPIRDINTAEAITQEIPTIIIDRSIYSLPSIQADYYGGGRKAAEHLVELGHRNIGVISGPTDILSMRERCDGAISYIEEHASLAFSVKNAFSVDLEAEVARAVISGKATAVFAGSDLIALGVIRHAAANGLNIPNDLSVVGFDDIPWAQMSTPPLTTIEMPIDDMALEAVDTLVRHIDEHTTSRKRVVFDTNLIIRSSTRAI